MDVPLALLTFAIHAIRIIFLQVQISAQNAQINNLLSPRLPLLALVS